MLGSMMGIPDLFRCPISLDLFNDPVTLRTGQTYDRPFIEKWLADGNLTCPVTMQRLEDTSLVPNHTLRHLITQWLLASPAANFSLSVIKQYLQSSDIDTAIKLESLRKVRTLSVESDAGQAHLIQLGFFPILLQFLLQSPSNIAITVNIAELALECILTLLPSADLSCLNMLKHESQLDQLVLLLEQGNASIQTGLCSLIESIALSETTRELCLFLGQSHRLLQALISILCRTPDAAVRAVSGICTLEGNRENVVNAGGVDGLITYLTSSSPRSALRALATMEALLHSDTGKKAALKNSCAVDVLVRHVFRVSPGQEGSAYAVGALLELCGSSARARAEAVGSGVITQLLLFIQSQCSVEAKAKARALLKQFRFMWAEEE